MSRVFVLEIFTALLAFRSHRLFALVDTALTLRSDGPSGWRLETGPYKDVSVVLLTLYYIRSSTFEQIRYRSLSDLQHGAGDALKMFFYFSWLCSRSVNGM